jgi:TrmH family RNA methyltransferase
MDSASAPPVISSLQNPTVKSVVRLRDARGRRQANEFLIDGNTEILRAIAAGLDLSIIFVEAGEGLPLELQRCEVPVQPVTRAVLEKISYGERGAAPVAVARTPDLPLSRLKLSSTALVLVLDRIEKPGNLGACLRTSAACGADAVILTNPVCEVFNPNTIRASRGAVFTLPVAIASVDELLQLAKGVGLKPWAARVDGSSSLWDCDFTGGSLVVFGSESQGLGDDWRREPVHSFQIPMSPRMDSLNVSISTAVTLYEAVRQRGG